MRRDPRTARVQESVLGRLPVPDYVAFDLETTGLSPDDDEILEIALVRFESGKPVERWSTLLNPARAIPLKVLRLTHIDEGEILNSPAFSDIADRIAEVSAGLPLVGHNSPFDTAFLVKRLSGFPGVPVYDTLELARIAAPGFKSYKLVDLARELGIPLTDAHRAYDDAEVSGVIFAMIQERVLSMERRVRESVASVMGREWEPRRVFLYEPPGPMSLPLFEERKVAGPARSVQEQEADRSPAVDTGAIVRQFVNLLRADDGGTLAANVPMLPGVARALATAAHEHAASSGRRLLLAGFPESALPTSVKRAPVPQDYLCLRKFRFAQKLAAADAYSEMDIEEKRFLASLAVWGEETHSGSFGEIQIAGVGYAIASEVGCPKDMECRSSCSLSGNCYYLLDENRSMGTGAQAMRRDRAFAAAGSFDRVIVWGAHELHRAWHYSEDRADLGLLREALDRVDLMDAVSAFERLKLSALKDLRAGPASVETRKNSGDVAAQLLVAAASLRTALRARFAPWKPDDSDAAEKAWADPPLVSRDLHLIESASAALSLFASPSSDHLSLVEAAYGDESRGPFLVRRSVWPAKGAVSAIESRLGPAILLSDVALEASATEGGRRLMAGTALPVTDLTCGTGTPGADNFLVVSPDVRVAATGPAFTEHASGLLRGLACHVRRGLLALFPSRAQIRDVYSLLVPELEKEGIVVYAQGIDGGRKVLEHLLDDDAIVLATFGGAPGDDEPIPSCLVVVKVPFPPPNVLDDARRKELSGIGADGFIEVNVRPSSLAVRAHAARMIASGGRRAIVFGDPRLSPGQSKWAGEFFRALSELKRDSGPVDYLVHRVSRHFSGNP